MKNKNTPPPVEQSEEVEQTEEEYNRECLEDWTDIAALWRKKIKELEVKYIWQRYDEDTYRYSVGNDMVIREDWKEPTDLKAAKAELREAECQVLEYKRLLEPMHPLYKIFNAIDGLGGMFDITQTAAPERIDLQPNMAYLFHFKCGLVVIETPADANQPNFIKALSEAELSKFLPKAKRQGKKVVHCYALDRDINLYFNWSNGLPGFTAQEIKEIVMDHKRRNQ